MKPNKYTLLDKSELNGQDLEFKSDEPNPNKKESNVPYSRLQDDFDEKHLQNSKESSIKPKNQNYSSKIQHPPPPQIRPITYDLTHVKNSVIHIGSSGITVQPKAPYIPPILIDCPKCTAKQQIPGNVHEFICYGCHENSKIDPQFGIFICGVCHNHVCYPYKTSQHIQCNYCFTVNRVPIEPNNPLKSKKMEQILPKDLREQEVIIHENNDFPDLTTVRGQEEQRETFE